METTRPAAAAAAAVAVAVAAVAAAAIARMNQNALLAPHAPDALNLRLNARRYPIIHGQRISMRRDR